MINYYNSDTVVTSYFWNPYVQACYPTYTIEYKLRTTTYYPNILLCSPYGVYWISRKFRSLRLWWIWRAWVDFPDPIVPKVKRSFAIAR